MKKSRKLKLVFFIVSLVALMLLAGCGKLCPECEVQEECEICFECSDCIECEVCPEYEGCDVCDECDVCDVCGDSKDCQISEGEAMLAADNMVYEIDEVGDDNETEVTFDYWVYNYGDSDADDIEIRCKLMDGGDVAASGTDSIGSLNSESLKSGDLTVEEDLDIDETYTANCYVENCTNCDILYKRIDDLVDIYEEE